MEALAKITARIGESVPVLIAGGSDEEEGEVTRAQFQSVRDKALCTIFAKKPPSSIFFTSKNGTEERPIALAPIA